MAGGQVAIRVLVVTGAIAEAPEVGTLLIGYSVYKACQALILMSKGHGDGGGNRDDADKTVAEVLKGKKGSIKNAPLPPGSPSWQNIMNMTMKEVQAAANQNVPGFKTIWKLLTDGRFNK